MARHVERCVVRRRSPHRPAAALGWSPCTVCKDSFIPLHAPRTRLRALDTPFRQNPRTNGTFAALRGTCCEASVGSPSWPARKGTGKFKTQYSRSLHMQHVPQGRKSAVCTGILSKQHVKSAHTSLWSTKWNKTVLPDYTQTRYLGPRLM